MSDRLPEFQRNAAFVAFVLVVCFSAFVYLVLQVRYVLIPLVWAGFFAVPLTALTSKVDAVVLCIMSWLRRRFCVAQAPDTDQITFTYTMGENRILVDNTPAVAAFLRRVNRPCVGQCWCGPITSYLLGARLLGNLGQRRVRISQLDVQGAASDAESARLQQELNSLKEGWSYYVGLVGHPAGPSEPTPGAEDGHAQQLQLELYLDFVHGQYPAVWQADEELTSQGRDVRVGTMEVDRTSTLSWACAIVLTLVIMFLSIAVFIRFVYLGSNALVANAPAYSKGVQEFIKQLESIFKNIPAEQWKYIRDKAKEFMQSFLSDTAADILGNLRSIGGQVVLFVVILCFWLSEPLPMSTDVAQVFKSYLFLKTAVCLLFAAIMSILLICLRCPLWHLFFVITFALNYIPEVGALVAGVLMLPAVLFDGNLSLGMRQFNATVLIIVGIAAKVITGNIIEVRMYATQGGEFMRMHPVVLMVLITLCGYLLGVTGMFLAIPIMAAVKYYMVTTNIPNEYLSPLLVLIEGDNTAPHKNYVDRQRAGVPVAREELSGTVSSELQDASRSRTGSGGVALRGRGRTSGSSMLALGDLSSIQGGDQPLLGSVSREVELGQGQQPSSVERATAAH